MKNKGASTEEKSPKAIVAIGASAGGLEAIQDFFDHMPLNSGLSFIVIQHLSPDFKSLMDQLLKRNTQMQIVVPKDHQRIEPNTVYLIPQKQNMTVENGHLLLKGQLRGHHLNLPIDIFFESLAQSGVEKAVGVVFSGTGSDGTKGISALSKSGFMTIVQEPQSAAFDGMPRNAISTGCVRCVMETVDMPTAILAYLKDDHAYFETLDNVQAQSSNRYAPIFSLLINRYNTDFNAYKPATISRRIDRRIALLGSQGCDDYLSLLESNSEELEALYQDLLIGVTSFFRDPDAFEALSKDVLPELVERAQHAGRELRIWVPACSTGEEAYTIGILLLDYLDQLGVHLDIKIFGTDINKTSLDIASRGIYDLALVQGVPQALREKYFVLVDQVSCQVTTRLRKMVVFAPHNLLIDPPFTRMDLISCRNFLIYIESAYQRRVLEVLTFALRVSGYLMLGASETLGDQGAYYAIADSMAKLFEKRTASPSVLHLSTPNHLHKTGSAGLNSDIPESIGIRSESTVPLAAYDSLLSQLVQDSVLVDVDGGVIHVYGNAGRYLCFSSGRVDRDILKLVSDPFKAPLSAALHQVKVNIKRYVYTGITDEGFDEPMKISVDPILNKSNKLSFFLIQFSPAESSESDSPKLTDVYEVSADSQEVINALESELQSTRESLQSTIEEFETTNEELQSTNEELLTSNEELQSTNEELHSVNEELYTVNSEHQKKIDELTIANADVDNLLKSNQMGTIFVDLDMRIRRYTPSVSNIFSFVPHDVGRLLEGFSHTLKYDDLIVRVSQTIKTREPFSEEVQSVGGDWFLLRILPYFTPDKLCKGAVISFIDIADIKKAQEIQARGKEELERLVEKRTQALIESEHRYSEIFENSPDLYCTTDPETRTIQTCNQTLIDQLGYDSKEELIGKDVIGLYHPDCHEKVEEVASLFEKEGLVDNIDLSLQKKNGSALPVLLKARSIRDEAGAVLYTISSWRNITDAKQFEHDRAHFLNSERIFNEDTRLYQTILNAVTDGWWDWDLEKNTEYLSPSFKALFGYADDEMENSVEAWQNILFPGDAEKVRSAINEHLKAGKSYYLPLRFRHRDGHTVWVICRGKAIRDADGVYRRMVGTHTDISALKQAENQLKELAENDSLTQLPNRPTFIRGLEHAIARAKRSNQYLAVMYLDLDDFKKVNDTHGHGAGDALLVEAGRRLAQTAREGDTIARIGGDEFVVLLEQIDVKEEVGQIAKRMLDEVSKPYIQNGRDLSCSASVGISLYPIAGENVEELLKSADIALYAAKKSGKHCIRFFNEALDQANQRRELLEKHLKTALEKDEFSVVYQPQINTKTGDLWGFEALLRWHSEEIGEISPAEFIPVAEEVGLIIPLGLLVVQKVCAQMKQWRSHFVGLDLKMSVNFSPVQLVERSLSEELLNTLKAYQVHPKHFVVEITETALMRGLETVRQTLEALQKAGMQVAIDDFGTGYSSMAYLKVLPVNILKIDQGFVADIDSDPNDAAIVKAIIGLGQVLELTVLAEGVESQQQKEMLDSFNCPVIQGYFYSRPKPAAELENLFEKNKE